MKKNQKGFIIPLFVSVAVLVVLGGVYIYSQQNINQSLVSATDRIKLNTYTNTKFSFSFLYPAEWYLNSLHLAEADSLNFTKVLIPQGKPIGGKGILDFYVGGLMVYKGRETNPQGYFDYYYPSGENFKRELVKINGIPVVKYQELYDLRYIFFTNDQVYQFVLRQKTTPQSEQPPYELNDISKVESIIASFKFTDSNKKFVNVVLN
ncbi:MAG: hypothetical protein KBD47_03090 [Candidatus Pacebacteria bacterium]|jgi:hypothetical protein|nr:hypothetical protein [Candidatus Paceibacterota bacterium]